MCCRRCILRYGYCGLIILPFRYKIVRCCGGCRLLFVLVIWLVALRLFNDCQGLRRLQWCDAMLGLCGWVCDFWVVCGLIV